MQLQVGLVPHRVANPVKAKPGGSKPANSDSDDEEDLLGFVSFHSMSCLSFHEINAEWAPLQTVTSQHLRPLSENNSKW